jgi:hypothetical protein
MEPKWEASDELIICKTNFTQEWAIMECTWKGNDKQTTVVDLGIPDEYKKHSKVFSEEGVK